MADLLTPTNRKELFLSAAAGQISVDSLPKPVDRIEKYLRAIAENGTGGGGTTNTYTKEEIDNKISALMQEIDWKETVDTFADLAAAYPDAADGWTASVKDTDRVYRFNGTEWVDIYNLLPLATKENDGLMSSGQADKLAGLENYDDTKIKDEIKANSALLVDNAGKNLLKITAEGTVNKNGGTFIINTNERGECESIVINGTFTEETTLVISTSLFNIPLDVDLIFTCVPSGGSFNSYRAHVWGYNGTSAFAVDFGEGVKFKLTDMSLVPNCAISIAAGYTAKDLICYPMIRRAEITDGTFEPYCRSQKQLDWDLSAAETEINKKALMINAASFDDLCTQMKSYNLQVCNFMVGGINNGMPSGEGNNWGGTGWLNSTGSWGYFITYSFIKNVDMGVYYRRINNGNDSGWLKFVSENEIEEIKSVIDDIETEQAEQGGKIAAVMEDAEYNLLEITAESVTNNGITFTVSRNEFGQVVQITANGTAAADATLYMNSQCGLPEDEYNISLGTDIKGSGTTFLMDVYGDNYTGGRDTISSSATVTRQIGVARIVVIKGYTAKNLTFCPMITRAEYAGLPFKPYVPDNMAQHKQINAIAAVMKDMNYNLLHMNINTSDKNGMKFLVEKNSAEETTSITLNGTASVYAFIETSPFSLPVGEYVLSGYKSGNGINLGLRKGEVSSDYIGVTANVNGNFSFSVTDSNAIYKVRCWADAGVSAQNAVMYPMITRAEYAGLPFKPYVPDNTALQEEIKQLKEQINELRALHALEPAEYSNTSSLQKFTQQKLAADVIDEPLIAEVEDNTELTIEDNTAELNTKESGDA